MEKKQLTWSGFYCSFTETTIWNNVPEKSGIYLLWVYLKTGEWKCYYVGQAVDLKTRLLQHLSDSESNERIKNYISNNICGFEFALVRKQSNRDKIEKYLYDYYCTKSNEISAPSNRSMEVNLP